MTEVKLGQLITGTEGRDAIHIAIAPVEATEWLEPGDRITLEEGSRTLVHEARVDEEPVGIVDPFLRKVVQPGERFYMFLFPGTVTSLRHVWSHPKFTAKPIAIPETANARG